MISDRARGIAHEAFVELERSLTIPPRTKPLSIPDDVARHVALRLEKAAEQSRHSHGLSRREARVAAERLVGLEGRAVRAEVGLGRMRGRRLYRVADVLAGWVRRPWRLGRLFGGLREASGRVSLPELPVLGSVDDVLDELVSDVAAAVPRRLPYPHVRVAHVGELTTFGMVASHFDLAVVDFDEELNTGFDLLLVEPGVDDPLAGLDKERLSLFVEAGIPVLLFARTVDHLDSWMLDQVDLVVTEDPELAETATSRGLETLLIDPSVDETVHNPVGWKQHPKNQLMVVADHPDITDQLPLLTSAADQISLYGPTITGLGPDKHTPTRPTGTAFNTAAKEHLAAYTTPQLSATPTSHIQQVLDLTAAGIPVITTPNQQLDRLLDGHYLQATTSEQLQTHLETLQHPPTRERLSIPARRHILTNHTRTHRFEQLLTHHHIPTNPTPKISILLSTKRPDYIEHALNSVTTQNWPNKELILILHGEHNFDLPHIKNLTSQLPYPTKILPLPENTIFGDALNHGLDQATGQYITKIDDDDHYGPNHLTDIHTAHTYSNAQITGKLASIVHIDEVDITVSRRIMDPERYHHHVAGPTLTAPKEVFDAYRFLRRGSRVDTTLLERVQAHDDVMYITHPYGFILERRDSGHTWQLEGYQHFVKNAVEVEPGVSDLIKGAG